MSACQGGVEKRHRVSGHTLRVTFSEVYRRRDTSVGVDGSPSIGRASGEEYQIHVSVQIKLRWRLRCRRRPFASATNRTTWRQSTRCLADKERIFSPAKQFAARANRCADSATHNSASPYTVFLVLTRATVGEKRL